MASCLRPALHLREVFARSRRHAAPALDCECGIYAVGFQQVDRYLDELAAWQPRLDRVIDEVSLWGTVLECERGFRASHAYPLRLYVPADGFAGDWRALADGLAAYRVPVEFLSALRVDAALELKRRRAA